MVKAVCWFRVIFRRNELWRGAASVGSDWLTTLGSVTVIDKLFIEPKTIALPLMDFQRMEVDSYAVDKETLMGGVKRLAVTARNSGAMVILCGRRLPAWLPGSKHAKLCIQQS